MATESIWQIRDELWEVVEPLLPEHRPDPRGGRPRVDDRRLRGDRLRTRHRDRLAAPAQRARLLAGDRTPAAQAMAARRRLCPPPPRASAPAQRGGQDRLGDRSDRRQPFPRLARGGHTGPSPVDRARTGSKHHLLSDSRGVPLAISLTAGNRNDVTQLLPLIDGFEPLGGRPGRPRKRPDVLLADRGYDFDKYRRELRLRGIKPLIARRETEHGSGLGKKRWVVERGFAWLPNFRRLRTRYERLPELHLAFLELGCAVICQRMLGWSEELFVEAALSG